ncbi:MULTISPECIES: hypothetical protein [unclassified Moorena]|nr:MULTISPECIES: hypothetical protein [unclassified Moorena]
MVNKLWILGWLGYGYWALVGIAHLIYGVTDEISSSAIPTLRFYI